MARRLFGFFLTKTPEACILGSDESLREAKNYQSAKYYGKRGMRIDAFELFDQPMTKTDPKVPNWLW